MGDKEGACFMKIAKYLDKALEYLSILLSISYYDFSRVF